MTMWRLDIYAGSVLEHYEHATGDVVAARAQARALLAADAADDLGGSWTRIELQRLDDGAVAARGPTVRKPRRPGRPRGTPKTGGRMSTGRMGAAVTVRLSADEVTALDAMRDRLRVVGQKRPSRSDVLRAPLVTAG